MAHDARVFELNVAALHPQLLPNGNVEITVPVHQGPVFTSDFVEHLKVFMSEREVEVVLDDAADAIMRRQVAVMIVK